MAGDAVQANKGTAYQPEAGINPHPSVVIPDLIRDDKHCGRIQ